MDAVTVTLLARITGGVTNARLMVLRDRNADAVALLGDLLNDLAALERRMAEGRV